MMTPFTPLTLVVAVLVTCCRAIDNQFDLLAFQKLYNKSDTVLQVMPLQNYGAHPRRRNASNMGVDVVCVWKGTSTHLSVTTNITRHDRQGVIQFNFPPPPQDGDYYDSYNPTTFTGDTSDYYDNTADPGDSSEFLVFLRDRGSEFVMIAPEMALTHAQPAAYSRMCGEEPRVPPGYNRRNHHWVVCPKSKHPVCLTTTTTTSTTTTTTTTISTTNAPSTTTSSTTTPTERKDEKLSPRPIPSGKPSVTYKTEKQEPAKKERSISGSASMATMTALTLLQCLTSVNLLI